MRTIQLLRKLDPAEWGGTEMAMQRLFDGLKKQGVKTIVYCPRIESGAEEDPLLRSGHEVQRFNAFVPVLGISEVRRRQMVAVGGNLMSFGLVSSLWREKNVSLIHSHALGRIGGIGRTIARQRQVPFVLTIHGGLLDLPENVRKDFNAPLEHGWEWGKKRIVVQPHGIEPEKFSGDHRERAKAAFPQIRDRSLLLSVGRIDPIKNQGWLLEQMPEILRKHPRALLVLAGACTNEPYGELIEKKIRQLGLQDKVLLTGGLPSGDPRLIGLLQEARAVILPSVSETFGLVILEAWAAGAVVLSSRTSGASALIEPGRNGWLFDLNRPETFLHALDETLADPLGSSKMARSGAEKVRANYTLSAVASSVKALYEELIEERQCVT